VAIHVALNHASVYRYDRWVGLSPQVVRLRPAPHCRTPILSYSLRITPEQHFVNWQQDPQGNYLARVVFPDKVLELRVEVDLVAELAVYNPFDFFLEPHAETFPFVYEAWQLRELQPFLEHEAPARAVRDYAVAVRPARGRTIDALVALNQRLQHDISYLIRLDPGVQAPEQTLALASGSCRDSSPRVQGRREAEQEGDAISAWLSRVFETLGFDATARPVHYACRKSGACSFCSLSRGLSPAIR
jgi:transglutaminase-like putative cysteine protease